MWIQNVGLTEIQKAWHFDPGCNSMLIQIVDPCMEFPVPKFQFKEVHQFDFLDVEDDTEFPGFEIQDDQAAQIAALLQKALKQRMNVIVHCVAGVCRSGAVCEVGIIMGFEDTETHRIPNLLVKKKLLKAIGASYE